MNRRRARQFFYAASAMSGLVAFAQTGLGDDAPHNSAAAQALYDEARRLVRAGDVAAACPKFKLSYQLDPGGGTLLNLADCYEKQGKTALSWSTFKEALVAAERDGRADRAEFARHHISGLEARLSRLTVRVAGGPRPPGFTVLLDGSAMGEAAWGMALPVDPGKHTVRAEAPGKRPFEVGVDVAGGAATVDVPASLEDVPVSAPKEDTAARSTPAPMPGPALAPVKPPERSGTKATVGWVVGGVGVAGLGVGSFFGLRAISRWNDRVAACSNGCTSAAKAAGDDANTAATIADVGFGVGVAALAVGAYLILSGSSEKPAAREGSDLRVTIAAGPRDTGLAIGGRW